MGVHPGHIGSPVPRNLGHENSASAPVYKLAPSHRVCDSSLCGALATPLSGRESRLLESSWNRLKYDAAQGRRSSEKASLRRRPPAVRQELASSPMRTATDSTSSAPLGGLTLLPSSSSSSGS